MSEADAGATIFVPIGDPIGPGRLVLVVGPSGAGKDTVIGLARRLLADDPTVVFPRRVVTRPVDGTEDHDTLPPEAFAATMQAGAFALSWDAHGLRYGVPRRVDGDLQDGRTVICNVSRGIVAAARRRYRRVDVVLVTAPDEVLRARVAARGRRSDGDLAARLDRVGAKLRPDLVIDNVGHPDIAAATFVRYVGR